MFACLLLPRFRVQAVLRWRDHHGAVAIVDEASSKGLVLECNETAEARRILPGMTTAQAMAHDKHLRILPRAASQEECLCQLLIEHGMAISPEVEISEEGFCVANLHNAPRTTCWQQLADHRIALFREHGLLLRVGLAITPDLAILAARGAALHAAIIYDAPAFVSPMPITALDPSPALHATLSDWGIHTVGAFLALPASEVTERLGPEAHTLRRKVSGQHKRPLRLVRTPPQYLESFDFDYEVETTEPLLFLLRRFIESLSQRLQSVYRVARSLKLTIPLDKKSPHERVFSIPAPTADSEVLFRVLSTYLETLQLRHRPLGVRLGIEPSLPARDQLSLFESALRDPNLFGETLARLKALLGNDAVGVPQLGDSHRPDDFSLRDDFSSVSSEAEPTRYGLPLRRFRPSLPGVVQTMNGRPATLDSLIATGPVQECAGPYRLSGHWWDQEIWQTEEWDVELQDGGMFRLSRHQEDWRVEGCYEIF